MATKIAFKRGLSTALPAKATDGVFYLTTDTSRLYVGFGEDYVDLNKYVKIVANTTELANLENVAKNDFVYITSGNIFAVCTDPSKTGSAKWTQVNPDTNTNTNTYVTGVSAATVSSETNGDIKVSFNIQQQKKNEINNQTTNIADVPVSFTIDKAKISTAAEIAVAVSVDAKDTNGVTLKTSGGGSSGTGVSITGSGSVTVTSTKDAITIKGVNTNTTYTLGVANDSTNGVRARLTASNNSQNDVKFAGGTKITVTGTETNASSGTVTITHADTTRANTTGTALAPAAGGKFTIVSGVTSDNQGHVTGVETKEVTLPADNNNINNSVTVTAGTGDDAGKLTVAIKDNKNKTVTGVSGKVLKYTVNGVDYYNGQTLPSYYDKDEVDKMIAGIDAMVYKGVVGGTGNLTALPTTGVKIGDTYKVGAVGTYGKVACKVGDILIAQGVEDTTKGNATFGTITSGLIWDRIESGDIDTTYTFGVTNNAISLKNNTNNSSQTITIAGGTALTATTKDKTITINHDNVTASDTTSTASPAAGGTFTAVDSVSYNSQGHITGVNTKTITLPADNNTTYSLGVNATDKAIRLTSSKNANNDVKFIEGTNTTVAVDGTNKTIQINHDTHAGTKTGPGTASALSHGGTFDVITGVTLSNGHVDGYTVTQYKLPSDSNTTYSLTNKNFKVAADKKSFTYGFTLHGSNNSNDNMTNLVLKSSTLEFEQTADKGDVNVDLVWGTF